MIKRMPNELFFRRVPMFWIILQFGVGVFVGSGVSDAVGVTVGVFVIVGVLVTVGVIVIVGVRVTVGVGVIVAVTVGVGKVDAAAPLDKSQAESLNSTVNPKLLEFSPKGACPTSPSKPPSKSI